MLETLNLQHFVLQVFDHLELWFKSYGEYGECYLDPDLLINKDCISKPPPRNKIKSSLRGTVFDGENCFFKLHLLAGLAVVAVFQPQEREGDSILHFLVALSLHVAKVWVTGQ